MVARPVSFMLALFVFLGPSMQPATSADADVWTAAVEALRSALFGRDRGDLVIVNQTIPTSDFHQLLDSRQETDLLARLRRRNDSTRISIKGVRLPPRTRLVAANSVQNAENSSKALRALDEKLLRFSLPAFSDDGTRAVLYYWATGGFDDSQGGYFVFEKKQGQWAIVDALDIWIT